MSARNRWGKFWWSDHRSDALLGMCSIAARGLWMEMLCWMAECERPGYLLIAGKRPTAQQIASMCRCPPDDVVGLLTELEKNGVFSRTQGGVIYSRRIVRDHEQLERDRTNGKKGGNPRLRSKPSEPEIAESPDSVPESSAKDEREIVKPKTAQPTETTEQNAPRLTLVVNRPDKARSRESEAREEKIQNPAGSGAAVASPLAAPHPEEFSIRTALWRDCVPILIRMMGCGDKKARGFLGRLLSNADDDAIRVYGLVRQAESLQPAEVQAFLIAQTGGKRSAGRESPTAWMTRKEAEHGIGPPPIDPFTGTTIDHPEYEEAATL